MKALFKFATKLSALATIFSLAGCLGGGSDSSINVPDPGPGPDNSAPSISGTPPANISVGATYAFTPSASDPDGDLLTFSIENRPTWAQFESGTGSLSGAPTLGDIGAYANIRISVSDGQLSTAMPSFSINVATGGSNSPPAIVGSPQPAVTVGQTYSFTPLALDPDGDPLTFSIQNRPAWASFDTSNGRLLGTPAAGDVGTYANILISVSDGQLSASLPGFSIQVNPGSGSNSPPTISGLPPSTVTVGQSYVFSPLASDPDGDFLTFSIQNRPAWATFDTNNGRLIGSPTAGDVGTYGPIQISVSDGQLSASLPSFSIEVLDNGGGSNNPPTISGTPPAAVTVGQTYSFLPTANDPDGDLLTFNIQNLPGWANFDTNNGGLSGGVPTAGDVGVYSNIRISVSDGEFTASLPDFDVEVTAIATGSTTLEWVAPTLNDDGTTLTDLDGYIIFYGTSSRNYTEQIQIDNESLTLLVVDNLTSGVTYYFAGKSFNTAQVQSRFSGEVVRTIQ